MTVNYGALAGIAALSSGLNFAGGMYSSNISSSKASKLAAKQAGLNYAYNTLWAQNSPSYTRAGLEKAGYNPMLAVQNGVAGANASFASPNSANDVDLGLSSGIGNAMDLQRMANETNQTKSNIALNEATAENQNAEARNKIIESDFIEPKARAEIANIELDTQQKSAIIDNMKARLELDEKLGLLGIAAQKYSSDNAYNASTYHSNTMKSIADEHSPSGSSSSFKNYASGISDNVNAFAHLLHGFEEYRENDGSNENTGSSKGKHSKHGKRK